MSLTEGLLTLSALVMAVLVAQGLWQLRRARPRRAVDVSARIEPELQPRPPWQGDPQPQEPQATGAAPANIAVDRTPRRQAAIDPLIDSVAEIGLDSPLTGDSVLGLVQAMRRAGAKPLLLEGLSVHSGQWEPLLHGQRYSALQAAVQLVNRSGPLNEIEYSEFVQKVQDFAEAIGASADFANMTEEVARARELDDFAREHDAQLAVHVQASAASWTVGYLQQCAARHGMTAGPLAGQVILAAEDIESPAMVMLTFDPQAALSEEPDRAAVRQCTLSLDVAQTEEAAEPFAHWQRLAFALTRDLDGTLIDDAGREVTLSQFAAIHQELQRLYLALSQRGLPAGSAAARRLFS